MSIKASYEVQSKRTLVEHVIRTVNEWRVLDDFTADGVEDFEAWHWDGESTLEGEAGSTR